MAAPTGSPSPPPRSAAPPRLAASLALGLAFYLLLPTVFWGTPGTGLDASWAIAGQMARAQGLVFGREYVFPHGPLGFVATRLPIGDVRLPLLAADLLLWGSLAWLLLALRRRLAGPLALACVPLLALCPRPLFYASDLVLFQFPLLLLLCFERLRTRRVLPLVLAAAIGLEMFLTKLNMGVAAALAIAAVLALDVLEPARRRRGLALLGLYALALAATPLVCRLDLAGYLRTSLHLTASFNEAMFLEPPADLGAGGALAVLPYVGWIPVAACFLAVCVASARRILAERPFALGLVLVAGYLLLLYKQSYVRADRLHAAAFLRYAPFALAAPCLFAPPELRRRVALPVALELALSLAQGARELSPRRALERPAGLAGYAASALGIAPPPSPPNPWPVSGPAGELLATVGDADTDVLPSEVSFVWFNGLAWDPRPVVQSYSAFDAFLDGLNRAKYLSADAPRFLLFARGSVDDRYDFFDERRTKQAMLERYELTGTFGGFLLLERRASPRAVREEPLEEGRLALGEPLALEEHAGLQLLFLRPRYSLRGLLRSVLLRPPELEVTFELEDGRRETYRAVVPLVEGGVPVGRFVGSLADAASFFRGDLAAMPRVRSVTFHSPRPGCFEPEAAYQLRVLEVGEAEGG